MNNLYQIIKQLQETQGSKAKSAILEEHKDNTLLQEYLQAVLDPSISYYQTKVTKPKNTVGGENSLYFDGAILLSLRKNLADRYITGDFAKTWLGVIYAQLNTEGKFLLELLIKRKIDAGVGETMVLKTWPGLFFVPLYMRCSLMDEKIKAKFDKEKEFFVQLKADGSFAYLVVDVINGHKVITRNGNTYPAIFANGLAQGLVDGVYVGELEVYKIIRTQDGNHIELLDRKTGNGILNSVQQGDTVQLMDYEVMMSAWDYLELHEFEEGYSDIPYWMRRDYLIQYSENSNYVSSIKTHVVHSMDEAYKVYNKFTSDGFEGAVIKTLSHKWKDGTSRETVKLKIEFEAEYKITGFYEGEGKASGMLGGLACESSDGKIKFSVGSGFSDQQRQEFWFGQHNLIGRIVTIKANDIVTKRDSSTYSLFLPIFVEIRTDKTEADSYEHVVASLEAAKLGGKK